MKMPNKRDKNEELVDLTSKLRDKLLIVEGKKDKRALYSLGLRNIIAINGKPLVETANDVKNAVSGTGGVVILTDFDREGRKLAARLRVLLQRLKIHPNTRLRKMLMSFGKNKIEDFGTGNGVPADLSRGDYHVKVSTNINKIHNQGSHKSEGSSREA
jgi:5S rRNA maturation endonuclease (ribonuclease M5)